MLDRIRIVLIGTGHPGNCGATARAMKTMGLGHLAFVTPRCDPFDEEAQARASGAEDILNSAGMFESLDQAVHDCTLVVGCSARSRTLPWPMISPRELSRRLPSELKGRGDAPGKVAIVFGREDSGLSNDELQRCNQHVHIQANPGYSSLNLAAAVQVLCYECRQGWLEAESDSGNVALDETALEKAKGSEAAHEETPFGVTWDHPLASHDDLERFFTHLETSLIRSGFHRPDNPRQLMARLRRLYLRARLDTVEVNILRGMLTEFDKHTPND
ncbi:RNA methyltransferase [Larsenimonas salina]|uniref:RNA methyltransferase n=1 Tax=Larsenimonas salina TaxID=1295565 RepID=UPI002072E9BD|nr:RNA methyltransferase [Larsenimonas salina]MCM5704370.1 RNA methyltransferase [Larsenimonas salina]